MIPGEIQTGIKLISAERDRQIRAEGYDSAHDNHHNQGELAIAGACYALRAGNLCNPSGHNGWPLYSPSFWPFSQDDWKPKTVIRDLTRAGALIAAEIDRLLRAEDRTEVEVVIGDPKAVIEVAVEDDYPSRCGTIQRQIGSDIERRCLLARNHTGPHSFAAEGVAEI